MSAQRSEFSLGWKVLLAGFLGTMCGASPLPFNVLGFLFEPLNAEFGWTRTQVSIGVTIYGVTGALLAPAFGWLADRFGVRKVALSSLFAFAVIFASIGLTPGSLTVFYLFWLGIGLVGIGSTPVTWSRAISMWFASNRGLALGMMLIGTSVAAAVVPRLAVLAMETWSWRAIFPVVALMPLLVALPVGLAFFREPRPEERPAAIVGTDGQVAGMTLSEAIRTRQFWLLWLSIFVIAAAYGGAHIHMPSIVKDHGIDLSTAAGVMGIVGTGLLIGRIGTGFLLDRFWGPGVALPILTLPAIACYLLMGTESSMAMISIAALLLGLAAGAESDLIAYLASRYFGMAYFGRIYGMLYLPFGLMSAISPVVYGMVRDRTGSYDPILTVAAGMFVLGALLLLLLGRYPDEQKA
jgi:OFA family oxalate/formate antiporter-like MFS transporter